MDPILFKKRAKLETVRVRNESKLVCALCIFSHWNDSLLWKTRNNYRTAQES